MLPQSCSLDQRRLCTVEVQLSIFVGEGVGGLIVFKVDLFICVSLFSRVFCNVIRLLIVQLNFIVNALLNHIALKKFALHHMR